MKKVVRVELPGSLRHLVSIKREVTVEVDGPVTQRAILDQLEANYPALEGTIRDHNSKLRRPFIRFFACQTDLSHQSPDELLPDSVAKGVEPFLIVGAIAGG